MKAADSMRLSALDRNNSSMVDQTPSCSCQPDSSTDGHHLRLEAQAWGGRRTHARATQNKLCDDYGCHLRQRLAEASHRQGTVQPGHLQRARQKDGVWLYAMHLCKIHMLVEVQAGKLNTSCPGGKPQRETRAGTPMTMHQ